MARPAVFLDRDGTLIEDVGYPTRPEQIRILGGVARGLIRLAEAGFKLVVVTNQSAIARGLMSEDDLARFHAALDEQLALLGARVDAYYTCPHYPDASQVARPEYAIACDCRKPKPGLLLRAARDLDLDLATSWMVGDAWRDIQAGQAAGVKTIKLPAPEALESPRPPDATPTAEAPGLDAAANIILAARSQPPLAEPELPQAAPAQPHDQAPGEPPAAGTQTPPAQESPPAPPGQPAVPPVAEAAQATAGSATHSLQEQAEPAAADVRPADLTAETCARCGAAVPEQDIRSGAAGRRHGFLLCQECLGLQPREDSVARPPVTDELLREVLQELRRISRPQNKGSLTLLRLLAYVLTAGAVFCGMVLGLVGKDKMLYLQVAALLQLAAITLLVLERRS